MALCSGNWSGSLFDDISLLLMNILFFIYDFQCAMCRAVLESGADQKAAESLNDGIVYLMIIPYVLGFLTLVFLYFRFFKRKL